MHTKAGATPSKRYIRLELLIQEQYLKRCRVPKVSIMSTWIPCLSSRDGRYALACTCMPAAASHIDLLQSDTADPCRHKHSMPSFSRLLADHLAILIGSMLLIVMRRSLWRKAQKGEGRGG